MTLRNLRIFRTVCDLNSVTAAAEKLYLSQPAVSAVIGEMEQHFGVKLFDRISRRLHITEAGKRVYEYAAHILTLYDEMENGIRDWGKAGVLRIGSSITIGNRLLPGIVKEFSAENPEIKLKVTIDNSGAIERLVTQGELDVGLIEGVTRQPQLIVRQFMEDKLVVLCGRGHPLWEKGETSPRELCSYPFILREKGSGTRELFDSSLLIHNLAVEPVWESISTSAIVEAVAENLGLTALPYRLVEKEIKRGRVRTVEVPGLSLTRNFYLLRHGGKYLSGAGEAFIRKVLDGSL